MVTIQIMYHKNTMCCAVQESLILYRLLVQLQTQPDSFDHFQKTSGSQQTLLDFHTHLVEQVP